MFSMLSLSTLQWLDHIVTLELLKQDKSRVSEITPQKITECIQSDKFCYNLLRIITLSISNIHFTTTNQISSTLKDP